MIEDEIQYEKPVKVSDWSQPFKIVISLITFAVFAYMGGIVIALLERIANNTTP